VLGATLKNMFLKQVSKFASTLLLPVGKKRFAGNGGVNSFIIRCFASDAAIPSSLQQRVDTIDANLLVNNRIASFVRPKGVRMGWGHEVLQEFIPFTAELIHTKRRAFEHIAVGYVPVPVAQRVVLEEDEERHTNSKHHTKHPHHQHHAPAHAHQQHASNTQGHSQASTTNTHLLKPRDMSHSWLEITIPFYDHSDLRDTFASASGTTVRYGLLFEILDALAADIAYRHCGGLSSSYTIVTAAVDGVQASANIDISNDLKLQGYISYVGSSSMEVI
jgi:hypothetical protein